MVSDEKIRKEVEKYRNLIGETASSAYNGSNWVAKWKAVEVDEANNVVKAEFVGAHGSHDDMNFSAPFSDDRRVYPDEKKDAARVVARQLRGVRIQAEGEFAWNAISALNANQVGDVFESESDSFYGGWGNAEQQVKVKVQIVVSGTAVIAGGQEIRINAQFKTI